MRALRRSILFMGSLFFFFRRTIFFLDLIMKSCFSVLLRYRFPMLPKLGCTGRKLKENTIGTKTLNFGGGLLHDASILAYHVRTVSPRIYPRTKSFTVIHDFMSTARIQRHLTSSVVGKKPTSKNDKILSSRLKALLTSVMLPLT